MHLRAAQRQGADVGDLLEPLPIPAAAAALWGVWQGLKGQRRQAMQGLAPLLAADIEPWLRLRGLRLTPWELDTLDALDLATRAVVAGWAQPGRPPGPKGD